VGRRVNRIGTLGQFGCPRGWGSRLPRRNEEPRGAEGETDSGVGAALAGARRVQHLDLVGAGPEGAATVGVRVDVPALLAREELGGEQLLVDVRGLL
jgi:hypothetical protein